MANKYWVKCSPLDENGAPQSMFFSQVALRGQAGDPMGAGTVEPCIVAPFTFERGLFVGDLIGGKSAPGAGVMTLKNRNGALDRAARRWSWDARPIEIYAGDVNDLPGQYDLVFKGVTEQPEYDSAAVSVRYRDGQQRLDKGLLSEVYDVAAAPSNVGAWKVKTFGVCDAAEGVLLNAATRRYQWHSGDAIDTLSVADRLVGLTPTIVLSGGYAELASDPEGIVTAFVRHTVGAASSAPALMRYLATAYGGLSDPSEIDTAAFDAVEALMLGARSGLHIREQVNIDAALDLLASGPGLFWYVDDAMKLTVGRFDAPSAVSDFTWALDRTYPIERRATPIPCRGARVGWAKKWRPHTLQESADSVALATRNLYTRSHAWDSDDAEDAAVAARWPSSKWIEVPTLVSEVDGGAAWAAAERPRLKALYGVHRDKFDVTVKAEGFSIPLHASAKVMHPRYGLEYGKRFRVVRHAYDLIAAKARLTVWG